MTPTQHILLVQQQYGHLTREQSSQPLILHLFGPFDQMTSYLANSLTDTITSPSRYDYDKLKKCDPGPETHAVLQKRIDIGHIKSS